MGSTGDARSPARCGAFADAPAAPARRWWHGRRALGVAAMLSLLTAACRRPADRAALVAGAPWPSSAACRECHAEVFDAWRATDHARANRPVDPTADAKALVEFPPAAAAGSFPAPDMVLGNRPLWQPLLPAKGGRWQAHELAYDPGKREWFNVFGTEERRPGEWGHWTGRGMNWNSMCAQCHMTGYRKNYDGPSDAYRSSWVEHGVGCIQCHGPTKPGHGAKEAVEDRSPAPFHGDRQKMMQTCAPCHARNEQLTLNFQPGDNYHDHYRITLPVEPGVFWPDGQQRDEDFDWTSVLLSRMGHAGVTCLDCHDPHTTKTVFPPADNRLCLQCHAAPGRVLPSGRRAVPIDPVAHSHHADGGTGNACVACHMPTTTYMQRAPRHDHGWLKPDPLLTRELGIPNACSGCHADQPVEWAVEWSDRWYGRKLASRQRARARAVASAQAGRPEAAGALLALLDQEDIPAWRATLLGLLGGHTADPRVLVRATRSLDAADPLERAAAVRLIAGSRKAAETLTPLLQDPVRLVRLDAAWALSPELPPDSPARKELDAFLALALDQPGGRIRFGQDLANRGRLVEAEKELARAAEWDPYAPGIFETQAMVLAGLGRTAEAGKKFYQAAELAPADATLPMRAALAFAEAGRLPEAEQAFRLAVARDARFDRAWYNLGLLQAGQNRLTEASAALRQAEAIAPAEPDYPYALATVLLRMGDAGGARAAAERALGLAPGHRGAREILRQTGAR